MSWTMRGWTLAVLALGLAMIAAAPLAGQRRAGSVVVVGQVVDARSGEPLAGAVVAIPGSWREAVTDAEGRFRLRMPVGEVGVSISRLGYGTQVGAWRIGEGDEDAGVIALERDAVLLEALEVTVDRIERERRRVPYASRSFALDELATSGSPDAADFVRIRGGVWVVSCSSRWIDQNCVMRRGGRVQPCVVVDDAPLPGGFSALRMYEARDFARINVYRRGEFIQAYTPQYLSRLARTNRTPLPTTAQMMAHCGPGRFWG